MATNPTSLFVDAWGWIVICFEDDPFHAEVMQIYHRLRQNRIPIYTSDYVLCETINYVFKQGVLYGLQNDT